MKVLSFISQKGGSAKTTLAIHISVAALETGYRVALVDLDPQASATQWHAHRNADSPLLTQVTADELKEAIKECRNANIDIVIIDTAPHSDAEALKAAKLSDYLAIPCRPTILDLRAIGPTIDIAKEAKKPVVVILSACPAPHGVGEPVIVKEARTAISGDFNIPVWGGQITQRVAYTHALIDGRTVTEFEPDGKAAHEIRKLWQWFEKELSHE